MLLVWKTDQNLEKTDPKQTSYFPKNRLKTDPFRKKTDLSKIFFLPWFSGLVWISPTFPCFPGLNVKSKFLFLRSISVSNFCTIMSSPRLKKFLKLTFWNSLEWLNFCILRSFLYLRRFFFNLSFRNTLEWCHFWGKKKNSEVKIWKKQTWLKKQT